MEDFINALFGNIVRSHEDEGSLDYAIKSSGMLCAVLSSRFGENITSRAGYRNVHLKYFLHQE